LKFGSQGHREGHPAFSWVWMMCFSSSANRGSKGSGW
jgi:hypothetical protein